ncbi:DNA polymerase [Adoxophyes honmai nucleopolyhedrovirus]|uniref:DNA polymerase n=1 Tax=Adoxophyes honmai nucleopolyhedrovirus TaxID=224399 RepID=Q80LN8_NPVAH|nr:DNA polymerase [Adoxophyes honmai nucleopolyhedrovirus]BAC67309.1 DNA polymerase [Adoxophyes honmai nucleopolyhedrovirus]
MDAEKKITLLKYSTLIDGLRKNFNNKEKVKILPEDVFRITKMVYQDKELILFLTGYCDQKMFQFYLKGKCDLYSYKRCFNTHFGSECRNNCRAYKTMIMPGISGISTDKIRVVKYKRNAADDQKFALDNFLRDINRVHMQTNLLEGSYVSFIGEQTCINNQLVCQLNCIEDFYSLFKTIDIEKLQTEIVPVISCFDIETNSNGQRMSNPSIDNVISISVVTKRDKRDIPIALYYIKNGNDDLTIRDEYIDDDGIIKAVRFNNELAMIVAFFKLLPVINPDYVIDFNGDNFDLKYLRNRLSFLIVENNLKKSPVELMKICRYNLKPLNIERKESFDRYKNKADNHFFTYYVHVDLYRFMSAEQNDAENNQLNTVAEHYLQMKKVDLPIKEMVELYNNNCLSKIIQYNVQDCVLPIQLLLKLEIIDFLYTQCNLLYLCTDDVLSNISHKVNVVNFHKALVNTSITAANKEVEDPYFFNKQDLYFTSGCSGKMENKSLVDLTSFKRTKVPVQYLKNINCVKLCGHKEVCVYKGGKVLEPKTGLKKWVTTLDFNSLYLTIMMQEGVCLSNLLMCDDGNVYLNKNTKAINPKLLQTLLELRSAYKKKRDAYPQNSFQYSLYDKIQNAVKRIANSIYGYFGIFFKPLANYVTKIGRNMLRDAIKKIEAKSNNETILNNFKLSKIIFKVIYGDTDSSFVQVEFNENEIDVERRHEIISDIVSNYVLKDINASWTGYKMELENVISSLILLKKKKYCFLNSKNVIKYKGWLVKKDMPMFMRKTFRAVVDSYLREHSIECGLSMLSDQMKNYYDKFGIDNNYMDYSFSMTFNESTGTKASLKLNKNGTERKKVITIAKRCREYLIEAGADFIPGNGDRIPFLLTDVKGKIGEKAYPLKLFDRSGRSVSWIKHMSILCMFMNELIQVFGDNNSAFKYYFDEINNYYMSNQIYDVKYPVLMKSTLKKKINIDSECEDVDDDAECEEDNKEEHESFNVTVLKQFRMYSVPKKNNKKNTFVATKCGVCNKMC